MTSVTYEELEFLQKNSEGLLMDIRLYEDLFMSLIHLSQIVLKVNYTPDEVNEIYLDFKSRGLIGNLSSVQNQLAAINSLTKRKAKVIHDDDLFGPMPKGAVIVTLQEIKATLKGITVQYEIPTYMVVKNNPEITIGFQSELIDKYKVVNSTTIMVK